jgi:hypothetical protein
MPVGIHVSVVVVIVTLYGTSTVYAFRMKMRETGITGALEAWRERPRLAITVGIEFALVMVAAAGATISTRWAVVVWTVAGLFFAYLTLHTIALAGKQAKAEEGSEAKAPAKKTFRRPWQPSPAGPAQAESAQAESAQAEPSPRGRRRPIKDRAYRAVDEWRTPVPDDYSQRERARQHAVTYQNGVPRPQALCGYQYDPLDCPPDGHPQIWGLGVPKYLRCKECEKALRDGGYPAWDIDPFPAHFLG